MSHIDELIAEMCPEGVEHRHLGEVGEFIRGNGLQKSDLTGQGVPAIHYGQIHTHYGIWAKSTKSFTSPELAAKLRRARPGNLIIVTTSEDDSAVAKATAWIGDTDVAVSGDAYIYRHTLEPVYVSYFFQSEQFQTQKKRHISGTKVRRISGASLAKILIPVPPLEVQREIVRILDQFTMLEAELEAELEARRVQRLAFSRTLPGAANLEGSSYRSAEHTRLGEVASQYVEPIRVQADATYTNLGVKWYGEGVLARAPRPGSEIKASTLYAVKPGQLIYNRMFVTEGSFAVVPPQLTHGVVSNEFPVYELDDSRVLPEWLLLYLQDEYTLKRIAAETTGVERGSMKSRRRWKEEQFEAFKIVLPPISVQREMIRVVGTVRALESSLRDELTARRKQHEYYRDRLLTFEEAAA